MTVLIFSAISTFTIVKSLLKGRILIFNLSLDILKLVLQQNAIFFFMIPIQNEYFFTFPSLFKLKTDMNYLFLASGVNTFLTTLNFLRANLTMEF